MLLIADLLAHKTRLSSICYRSALSGGFESNKPLSDIFGFRMEAV